MLISFLCSIIDFYAHKKRRLVINYFQNCLFRSVMRTSSSFRMSRVYMIFLDIFLMEPNMRNPTKKFTTGVAFQA